MDGLETEFDGRIAFQRINANMGDGPEIMQAYRISGHPTIIMVDKNGQEITRFIGPQSREMLANALQTIIDSSQN